MKGRRRFLIGGAAAALGAYSYHRGLRYPRMGYEPYPMPTQWLLKGGKVTGEQLIALDTNTNTNRFRAIAPEPEVRLTLVRGQFEFTINNIAPSAEMTAAGSGIRNIEEQQNGLNRTVRIDAGAAQTLQLNWRLAETEGFRFAVIGDTGGNAELNWCLNRANELNADFLIHLGDFHYGNGDYQRAIEAFHNAPMPCFITIGNHDFNDSGLVYEQYRDQLGRFNNTFELAGTRFVNFDTAADFLPANTGMRGAMFEQLRRKPHPNQIFFTHRPLRDARPGKDHGAGDNELDWLEHSIKAMGNGILLTGHVHHSAELDVNGIKQYTVGEGLGFEDLLLQRPVSQLLMGTIEKGQAPSFTWVDLQMPWSAHKSHTHMKKLKLRNNQRLIDWYAKLVT